MTHSHTKHCSHKYTLLKPVLEHLVIFWSQPCTIIHTTAAESMTTLEKLRNLWHGISKPPSSQEMVFFIFMLCLVTFPVILSQRKEKCSQGLSMSNKHLLWLSNASVFALVFNYRTQVGHFLFASAATVNNVYSTDYHTRQFVMCTPVSDIYYRLAEQIPLLHEDSVLWLGVLLKQPNTTNTVVHSTQVCHCEMNASIIKMLKPEVLGVFW